jgi:hypothetical protein
MLCVLSAIDQASGGAGAKLYSVAAYDFDSGVKTLSGFSSPNDLPTPQKSAAIR